MTKELLQQAHDALITSLAYVDATSAIAEVQGALKAIEQAIAQEQATHKPAGCRETWKCSHTWKCDNCGNGITLHEGQRYCHTKEMA